jgi:phosphotransferase system  glucose/maltose/N-acetylglucosamine-specific IIC component
MIALIIGIVLLLFGVYAVLPLGKGFIDWSQEVIAFLKGAAPVIALFIGLISLFIGIADIKDRIEAKKEEKEDREAAESEAEKSEGEKSED